MSTYAVTTGSAFRVAHNDGDPRVRWYTAADGSSWIGHDTHDVAYCCSRSCQTTVLTEAGFGDEQDEAGSAIRLSGETNLTADWGAYPCPDWPDYDVHCGGCEALLHEGTVGDAFDYAD